MGLKLVPLFIPVMHASSHPAGAPLALLITLFLLTMSQTKTYLPLFVMSRGSVRDLKIRYLPSGLKLGQLKP